MHEMSLAENILLSIEAAAAAQGFSRVATIRLEIGRLAAVEVDALCACLEQVLRDSVAAGAAVEVIAVAGAGVCSRCGQAAAMDEVPAACAACGGALRVSGGSGMRIIDLEVV